MASQPSKAPKIAPLVRDDLDLRDFPYMPLEVVRLRDSDLAALATGDEFRAAVLLWCAAWHQVPAASLPADDRMLARLAGFGRDVDAWMVVRSEAMRGFVLCADGRFYHPVIADKAIEADGKRRKQTARTAKATEARRRKDGNNVDERNDDRNDQRDDSENSDVTITKGREGKGEEEKGREENISAVPSARAAKPSEEFAKFWSSYPKRDGANPKFPAEKAFAVAIKSGTAPLEIIEAADRYRSQMRAKGQEGTPYVQQAVNWLKQRRWRDHGAGTESGNGDERVRIFRMLTEHRRRGGDWPWPIEPRETLDGEIVAAWERENATNTDPAGLFPSGGPH